MTYERRPKIKHIDLFSGIGGFAIAVEAVWGKEVEHIFCDNEPFSQAVLKKHWPTARLYGDIRTLTANAESEQMGMAGQSRQESHAPNTSSGRRKGRKVPVRQNGSHETPTNTERAYILTGGFPCQPFSAAGRRKGAQDDRYLWPEMLRVIREFVPEWVIAENVAGLLTLDGGMVFKTVCTDLEREGYEVGPFVIPAAAVGAPHRRDRIWIIAHAQHGASGNAKRRGDDARTPAGAGGPDSPPSDAQKFGRRKRNQISGGSCKRACASGERCGFADGNSDAPDSDRATIREQSGRGNGTHGKGEALNSKHSAHASVDRGWCDGRPDWNQSWAEIAARICRVDDGIPKGVDRSKRLKALGNAIVPQVAIEIMQAIKAASV